ncbi:copper resistance CopC family protein [Microcella sp.]|uniref:copper resistance CopC family protein n=1 Tax=Microcella sp. TaxID=1913979 RepID=UPI00256D2E3B|nr:copper resistance CopC family protein [Microcella sp.]MBX9470685.1 copper resistance protein CopC [Microcella sp.]
MSSPRTRSLAPLPLVGVLAVGFALAIAAPAAAHNFIVSSTPADGENLTELPEQWQITTNETLLDLGGQGAGFALLVSDEQGLFYGDGCVTIDGPGLSTPAALGADGAYTLTYQFVSADGHTLSGELPFTWQAPADFEPHVGLAEPPVCGETASAPAPEPTATAEPQPDVTDEPVVDAEPVEPVSDDASLIVIAVFIAVVVAIAGVVTAALMRARGRRKAEQTDGPEGADL